jgi:hypothetical protein
MSDTPPPARARRLTEAARRKLNELITQGIPAAKAMAQVSAEPGAFEEVPEPAPPPPPPPRPPWRGDSTDWGPTLEKLGRLRELDRGRTTFGASRHDYAFRPCPTERQIVAREKKLGAPLPPGLRAFYATVGDGGAGPDFGLYSLADLGAHRAATPYPGIAGLRELGSKKAPQPPEPTRALVSVRRLTGAVTLLTSGCSLYSAVVCTGDVGRVIHYDDDFVVETDDTLVGWYTSWLDDEITQFELVQQLHEAGASLDDMAREMKRLMPRQPAPIVRLKAQSKLRGLTAFQSAPEG